VILGPHSISHRRDMIFHDAGAWVEDGLLYGLIPMKTYMLRELQKNVPSVKDFRYGLSPWPMNGIISMKKTHPGEPKQAILSAFASELYLKHVIVVDDDIDLNSDADIFWSITTRAQADRDFLIIPGSLGTDLDISTREGAIVTKVGIDATAKPFRHNMPPVGQISPEHLDKIDISRYLSRLD